MADNISEEKPVLHRIRRWLIKYLLIVLAVFVGGASLYIYVTLHYVYAKGQRAGYMQKLSERGWLFKTYEGELAMVNLPGAMPEVFKFSIRKQDVAKKVEQYLGQRVTISYDQHRGIPVTWFGDTSYFATDVVPVIEGVPNPEAPIKMEEKKAPGIRL